jgi:hypothetical protein
MSEPHYGELADMILPQPKPKGISLRDWFAGTVLGGVIAATKSDTREPNETHEQMFARRAYALADAMLAAREPTQ